ncbi:hypothetical protein ACHAWO_000703 [Cyclotella atomus]|uniref:SCP domain-containing protein n=1 Tax=Cyclotella atomus TaxID=382360 RepID=A0ABD3QYB4_9STRA
MKFINIAFTLLFTSSANAASINREFDEQVQSSLRKSNRNVPGSSEDWLNALNAVRQAVIDDAVTLDDDYSLLEWSADLAAEAQTWANSLAAKCQNGVPDGSQNPGDYGVNTVLNMRNPVNTVDRWVTNGLNADKIPSAASNPMTQILWAGTKYVGCADATSKQSGTDCTSSVCYFGLAGNCAWSKYDSWEEAVMSGKACSSTCPSDGTC